MTDERRQSTRVGVGDVAADEDEEPKWGDPISAERQAELKRRLDAWAAETDHGSRAGPFDLAKLTGADVFCLAERVRRDDFIRGVPDLRNAHLERATLGNAHLERATLIGASLDKATQLNEATLTGVLLDQITFDNTNLTVVEWDGVPVLGDEARAREAQGRFVMRKSREERAGEYAAAARAYRLLAVALQAKGLGDIAARYLYRAQIMQRKRRWHERHLGAYLGSAFLALFAGYGYRLGRVFAAYGLTVAFFAALYVVTGVAGGAPLRPETVADAAQISLNAIHGRVFFAQFGLDTVQSWIATAESICGIVIEGVFVAVLIQRLFAR